MIGSGNNRRHRRHSKTKAEMAGNFLPCCATSLITESTTEKAVRQKMPKATVSNQMKVFMWAKLPNYRAQARRDCGPAQGNPTRPRRCLKPDSWAESSPVLRGWGW